MYKLLFLFALLGCNDAARQDHILEFGNDADVTKGKLLQQIVVDGELFSPNTESLVVKRIRWYWDFNISWTAEEGAAVKAGDDIIRLDRSTIEKDLSERQMELERQELELEEARIKARDDVEDARARVTSAEFEVKKQKLLVVTNDSVSAKERKKQELEVAAANSRLRRAKEKVLDVKRRSEKKVSVQELQVKRAKEEVEDIRKGLDDTTLKAGQDGIVIFPLFSTNSGYQKAYPGGSVRVNSVAAEIADPENLYARLFLPEIDAEGISEGSEGTLTLDILPGKDFRGKVKSIAGVPSTRAEREGNKSNDPADNVRQFEVVFALEKMPENAMPGMTVSVTLEPGKGEEVLRIPIDAITLDKDQATPPIQQDGNSATAWVFAQRKNESWQWHQVEIGRTAVLYAEVLKGLGPGDKVRTIQW